MRAIKITFKESAELCIFLDPMNYAGASGPSETISVQAGEAWYAPRSECNSLAAAAQKQIPVEHESFPKFHDLGLISRTTDQQPRFAQIAAIDKGAGVVLKPRLPGYEAQVVEMKTSDTTHEDFL